MRYLQQRCRAGQAVAFANHGTQDVIVLGTLGVKRSLSMDAVNDALEAVSISMAFLEVSALSRALTKARLLSALN